MLFTVWILQFIHVNLWTEFNTLSRSESGLTNFFSFFDNNQNVGVELEMHAQLRM